MANRIQQPVLNRFQSNFQTAHGLCKEVKGILPDAEQVLLGPVLSEGHNRKHSSLAPKSVNAPYTLLQLRRCPWQVYMDDLRGNLKIAPLSPQLVTEQYTAAVA